MGEPAAVDVFSALGDPVRLRLVAALADGDATVGTLAAPFDISVQAISRHLKVLEAAGVVRRASDDYRAPVQLNAQIVPIVEAWIAPLRRALAERYERLDAVLASMATTTDHRE